MQTARNRSVTAGFTLLEMTLVLVITGLLGMSVIQYFGSVSQAIVKPVITYGGNNYALAPVMRDNSDGVTKSGLFEAISLHREFIRQTQSADFVAVFGGTNANAAAPTAESPLSISFDAMSLPSLAGVSPRDLVANHHIAIRASADLSSFSEPTAGATAFTVLVFQGVNQIVAIAQVRRYSSTFNGNAVSLYETILRSREANVAAWTTYEYRFWLPVEEDVWEIDIGAKHYWYRYESTWWGRTEPTGSAVIFPDPFLLSVNASDARVKPVSRFSYFLTNAPQ